VGDKKIGGCAMTAVEMITREMETPRRLTAEAKVKSIIVATDGSDTALAAFKAAAMIASRVTAAIHVLSVLEPMPAMFPAVDGIVMPPELDRSREEAQRTIVGDQIKIYDAARGLLEECSATRLPAKSQGSAAGPSS
jgi:hypothetical protein